MKKIALTFLAAFFAASLFSLEIPELTGPVMDLAGIMSPESREDLEACLLDVDSSSSAQIAVLTIPSLEGESLEEYGLRVSREWGLGDERDDRGVLLLIAYEEKKIRIEVGYGAEGDLTDAKCGLIIRNVIAPEFQNGNYSEGISKGAKAIAGIVAPQSGVEQIVITDDDDDFDWAETIALTIFFSLYFIMFTGSMATKFSVFGWLPWASWFIRHAKKGGSNFADNIIFGSSGHSSGGFSSGGGGGGGFSGGGGGFGGGGASGGW